MWLNESIRSQESWIKLLCFDQFNSGLQSQAICRGNFTSSPFLLEKDFISSCLLKFAEILIVGFYFSIDETSDEAL